MATYLIVANRTLASPTLAEAIEERLGRGPASFHVVVPATPVAGGLTWDEETSRAAAEQRLEAIVQHLCDLGATDATGEIGVADPVAAAHDAISGARGRRGHPVDAAAGPQPLARPGRALEDARHGVGAGDDRDSEGGARLVLTQARVRMTRSSAGGMREFGHGP